MANPFGELAIYIARVTDVHDPARQGGVQVHIPELSGDRPWGWVRHASGAAITSVPRVNDLVLVAVNGEDAFYLGALKVPLAGSPEDTASSSLPPTSGPHAVVDGETLLTSVAVAAQEAGVPDDMLLAVVSVSSGWDVSAYDASDALTDWRTLVSPHIVQRSARVPADAHMATDPTLWGRYGLTGVRLVDVGSTVLLNGSWNQLRSDAKLNLKVGANVLRRALDVYKDYDQALAVYRGLDPALLSDTAAWPPAITTFVREVKRTIAARAAANTPSNAAERQPVQQEVTTPSDATGITVTTRGAPPYTYPGTMVSPGSFAAPAYPENVVIGLGGRSGPTVEVDASSGANRVTVGVPAGASFTLAQGGQRSTVASAATDIVYGSSRAVATDVVDVATGDRTTETEGTSTSVSRERVVHTRGMYVGTVEGSKTSTVHGAHKEESRAGRSIEVSGALTVAAVNASIAAGREAQVIGYDKASVQGGAVTVDSVGVAGDTRITSGTGLVLVGSSTDLVPRQHVLLAPTLDKLIDGLTAVEIAIAAIAADPAITAGKAAATVPLEELTVAIAACKLIASTGLTFTGDLGRSITTKVN